MIKHFLFFVIVFLSTLAFAGNGDWVQRLKLGDALYGMPYTVQSPAWINQEAFIHVQRKGLVQLDYTRKDQTDINWTGEWRLKVYFSYSIDNGTNYISKELEVSYENGNHIYSDYELFDINLQNPSSIDGYLVKIDKVEGEYRVNPNGQWVYSGNPLTSSYFPDDIDLTFELNGEEWYDLEVSLNNEELAQLDFDPLTYRANWLYVEGAEHYDFEWVWVDAKSEEYVQLTTLSPPSGVSSSLWPFLLKEPTRVRVNHTHHVLDKTYSKGMLYFRVRPITKYENSGVGMYDDIKEGEWSYFSNLNSPTTSIVSHLIDANESFESEKNWLFGIAYAEQGKSVSTVTFYDGSNRGRQSLTYNTSDDITLVGETKFDREGRQTVSVIPAPIKGRQLGYRNAFNITGTSPITSPSTPLFDEEDFDLQNYNGNNNATLASTNGTPTDVLGAGQYFSPDNQFPDDLFRAAIPNANGYVYSQTIYRNDGSGRIEEVGGIGFDFRVGGEHSVKTYYGSTNESELKRLFGSNVAQNPQGYRKEMVRDANGQHSVTYYDKRGNVIATALSGESPDNLIALEDQGATQITTTLNENNIAINDYTLKSENTFLNAVENQTITLEYDVASIIQQISAAPITINNATISLGDFCSTCQYDLTIEVLDQNGNQVDEVSGNYGFLLTFPDTVNNSAPFTQNIDPTQNCFDGAGQNSVPLPAGVSYGTGQLNYQLTSIGEYRIIKTLTVDIESMQAAFDAQLDSSGANDPSNFIADYTANVDVSGCFFDCNEYCEFYAQHDYEQINGIGSWAGLSQQIKDSLVELCLSSACDPADFYQDFDNDDVGGTTASPINPMDYACNSYRNQMIAQISPGGIFYDDQNSSFWGSVASGAPFFGGTYVNINGTNYTVADFQNPQLFLDVMADTMLPSHREWCHLWLCPDWASTMNYSNGLTEILTGDNPSAIGSALTNPTTQTTNGFSQDPFITQTWNQDPANSNNPTLLQNALANYYLFLLDRSSNGTVDLPPCTPNGSSTWQTGITSFNSTTNTSLLAYVNHMVECIRLNDSPMRTDAEYRALRNLMFKSNYDFIKTTLMDEYKAPFCPYYTTDEVFKPYSFTPSDIQNQINNGMADIFGGVDCAQMAYNNAVNWGNQLPDLCLTALSPTSFDLNFGTSTVQAIIDAEMALLASGNGATLQQLFYDYTMATCPDNTWGWFFDPDPQDLILNAPGEVEYDAIYALLANTTDCGIGVLTTFEVTPPPTVIPTNIVNQYFPPCFQEYMAMINDGFFGLNNNPSQNPSCMAPNVCTMFTINVDSTNYPILANECGLSGDFSFFLDSTGTTYTNELLVENGGCLLRLNFQLDSNGNNPNSNSYILYLDNWVKQDSTINPNTGLPDNVISFDVHYANGGIGSAFVYASQFDCIDLGGFSNMIIYDFTGPFTDTNTTYVEDCIEATIGQAEIDALILYNNQLNLLQNQLQEAMKSCVDHANENLRLTYTLKEYQYTLYYYDLAGNLVQTVPPQGVNPTTPSYNTADSLNWVWNAPPPVHQMETRYKYNGLNTLIAQYTPDGGHTDFVLDKLYRVRFSKNARQLDQQKASYTKYDELGRVAEAGEMSTYSSNNTLAYLESNVENNAFPGALLRMDHTITYYEQEYTLDPSIQAKFTDGEQKNLRNTIAAIKHIQGEYAPSAAGAGLIGGTEMTTVTSYSYDPHKNVQECVTTNYHLAPIGQQHKTVHYDYDLISGNVNELIYQQGQTDEYRHRYRYDANNRLVEALTSSDGGTRWEKEAKYLYYLHGALARVEIGEDEVQGIDYAYNLQGWLKGVNSTTLATSRDIGHDAGTGNNSFFGQDVFGFTLGYFNGDYQSIDPSNFSAFPNTTAVQNFNINDEATIQNGNSHASLYNGNISHMITAIRDYDERLLEILANNYRYDQLQRIKAMDVYYDPNLQATNIYQNVSLYNPQGGESAFRTRYSFDKNGNLKTLKRHGSGMLSSGPVPLDMDDFEYNYYQQAGNTSNSTLSTPEELNQLASVFDNVTGQYSSDIKETQKATQAYYNYVYDPSGQLTQDLDEGIQEITWTVTGKVKEIKFTTASGKKDLKFVYDPMDMRIMKIQYQNAGKTHVKYTYYGYDAQGNVMATYDREIGPGTNINVGGELQTVYADKYTLSETMIYGSSRLGVDNRNNVLTTATLNQEAGSGNLETGTNFWVTDLVQLQIDETYRLLDQKFYELSNHLGNVLEVITDRKLGWDEDGNEIEERYIANVVSYSDYYPYGMLLEGNRLLAGATSTGTQTELVEERIEYTDLNLFVDGQGNLALSSIASPGWELHGAISQQSIQQGEHIAFEIENTPLVNNYYSVGLSYQETDFNRATINYAFYVGPSGELRVYTDGSLQLNSTYIVGDQLKIKRDNGTIRFYKNGTQVYSTVETSSGLSMITDIAIARTTTTSGSRIYNLVAGLNQGGVIVEEPIIYSGFAGAQVNAYGDLYLSDQNYNGLYYGASSAQTVENGEYVEFELPNTPFADNYYFVGLSYQNTSQNPLDINFTWYMNYAGDNLVYDNGTSVWNSSCAVGDVYRILRDYGTIRYFKNGVEISYTSVDITPNAPMVVDITMGVSQYTQSNGSTIQNVVIGKWMISNLYSSADYVPSHGSVSDYRYGFQGQEKDDEVKGEGNSINYKYRMHDPRVGRFFAVDPLSPKYPWYTPYSFSGNKVIAHREIEGLEETFFMPVIDAENNSMKIEIVNDYFSGKMDLMFGLEYDITEYLDDHSYIMGSDEKWHKIPDKFLNKSLCPSDMTVIEAMDRINSWPIVPNKLFEMAQNWEAISNFINSEFGLAISLLSANISILKAEAKLANSANKTTAKNLVDNKTKVGTNGSGNIASEVKSNVSKIRTNGSIDQVNPQKGKINCVGCSIATDRTLAGVPTTALADNFASVETAMLDVSKYTGTNLFRTAGSIKSIENYFMKSGAGSRGIIIGVRKEGMGHAFNVQNKNGVIKFIDGQTGKAAENLSDFDRFYYQETTNVK